MTDIPANDANDSDEAREARKQEQLRAAVAKLAENQAAKAKVKADEAEAKRKQALDDYHEQLRREHEDNIEAMIAAQPDVDARRMSFITPGPTCDNHYTYDMAALEACSEDNPALIDLLTFAIENEDEAIAARRVINEFYEAALAQGGRRAYNPKNPELLRALDALNLKTVDGTGGLMLLDEAVKHAEYGKIRPRLYQYGRQHYGVKFKIHARRDYHLEIWNTGY